MTTLLDGFNELIPLIEKLPPESQAKADQFLALIQSVTRLSEGKPTAVQVRDAFMPFIMMIALEQLQKLVATGLSDGDRVSLLLKDLFKSAKFEENEQ